MIYPGVRSEIGSAIRSAHDRIVSSIILEPLLIAFFASGVKGVWHERSNSGLLFQDSVGSLPVVAPGNAVGLAMSRDQALVRGSDEVTGGDFSSAAGWSLTNANISGGTLNLLPSANVNRSASVIVGRLYEVMYTIAGIAPGGSSVKVSIGSSGGGIARTTNGTFTEFVTCAGALAIYFFTGGTFGSASIDNLSVREVFGNHQRQATAGLRPLYQVGPQRVVFDGVDDVLNTTFPAALGTSCTVGRAIPGTGAVITTGVNIGTSFADSETASALLIADRSLTADEAGLWTAYLNRQALL